MRKIKESQVKKKNGKEVILEEIEVHIVKTLERLL